METPRLTSVLGALLVAALWALALAAPAAAQRLPEPADMHAFDALREAQRRQALGETAGPAPAPYAGVAVIVAPTLHLRPHRPWRGGSRHGGRPTPRHDVARWPGYARDHGQERGPLRHDRPAAGLGAGRGAVRPHPAYRNDRARAHGDVRYWDGSRPSWARPRR